MAEKKNNYGLLAAAIVGTVAFSVFAISAIKKEAAKSDCQLSGGVYIEKTGSCREKTFSEIFDEQCTTGVSVGGVFYSCSSIKKAGLERAFINKNLVKHGNQIYEGGTSVEIQAGKKAGDYCLSAAETWSHIGETRCVVFYPEYYARSGYNYFIDEKKNYTSGFVVYMYGNYGWNNFLSVYKDKTVLVCGKITKYQGHPQIKTTPANTMTSPRAILSGSTTVYKNVCK